MKIRVLTMVMALMVMMVSVVSAQEYWNGNTNYPLVISFRGTNFYIDLSSAYIADKKENKGEGYFHGEYLIKYNLVSDSNNVSLHEVLIVQDKGASFYYGHLNGNDENAWVQAKGEAEFERITYNAGMILERHLLN